jgi:hypothetical protein
LPRKYHRPPPAKRRKSKRTAPAEAFAQDVPSPAPEAPIAVGVADAEPGTEHFETAVDNDPVATAPVRDSAVREVGPVRRINQDYSYVRGEIVQIAIIGGLIVLGLIITSIVR